MKCKSCGEFMAKGNWELDGGVCGQCLEWGDKGRKRKSNVPEYVRFPNAERCKAESCGGVLLEWIRHGELHCNNNPRHIEMNR